MRNKTYNVLENGKIVLENATAAEVRKLLKDEEINLWKYVKTGYKAQRRYTIKDTGKPVERENTKKKSTTNTVPKEMWEEWEKVCKMFHRAK